jgi:ATP-dependent DNA ligase
VKKRRRKKFRDKSVLPDTDLRQTPLVERKKRNLKRLIEGSDRNEIIYSQHVERDAKLLFQKVCERNLEGIVCKRRMGVYSEHGWLKIKNQNYTQTERRHEMFTAFHERRKSGKIVSPKLWPKRGSA